MMRDLFRRFAYAVSETVGSPLAFGIAFAIIVGWALAGPLLRFSEQWQLVINTATTVITFLMVFLLQSTQNRDAKATQIKLDELIRAVQGARTNLVNLEEMSDDELERLHIEFQRLRQRLERRSTAANVRKS